MPTLFISHILWYGMRMRTKVGLALGSGGPRGLAHIGVIKALLENRIPIDMIAGASSGALVGGLFLGLGSIDKVESIFVKLSLSELALMFYDIGFKSGVIKGDGLEKFIDRYLDGLKIDDLRLPFAAVTTDMNTACSFEIKSGNLTKALRASSSIPGFVNVAVMHNRSLVDGGVSQPVPVRAVRSLGAKVVIAVNLDSDSFVSQNLIKQNTFPTSMGMTAIKLLRYHLAKELCKEAEVVIEPDVTGVVWMNLTKAHDRVAIIQRGYEAAMEKMKEIKKLLKFVS